MPKHPKYYVKFIVALLAGAGVVASSGLLDGDAELWLNVAISAVGAALVAAFPNADWPRGQRRGRS